MHKLFSTAAVLGALALACALAPAALAGKPGSSGSTGTSSVTLRMVADANSNGTPNWGDTITFDVATTATTSSQLKVSCSQNGVLVFKTQAAYYDGNPFAYMQYMQLQSGAWTSGGADCTATLFYTSGKRIVTLTSKDFRVDA